MTALPTDDRTAPDHDELVRRAEALRDRLWSHAAQTDHDRRLDDDDVAAIRDAGLLALWTPARFGGHATSARTAYDVTVAIGRGDTSAGWVVGVLNTGNWLIAQFSERAQLEVWGDDPTASAASTLAATGTALPVEGGLRVSGSWGYCSGSNHCEWVVVGVPGAEPERSPVDLVLLPLAEVSVQDTWFVTGLRATGSNTVVADDVFVPSYRVLPMVDAVGGTASKAPEVVHHATVAGLLPLSLLGTQIGAADAALAHVVEKAPKRAIAYSGFATQTESAAFAVDVADAAAGIEAARVLGERMADELDEYAERGELASEAVRTRIRLDGATASGHVRHAVDLLVSAHGTSSFAEVNPLQRLWRDTAVGSRHIVFNTRIAQQTHGHSLLGLDPHAVSQIV